MVMSMIMTMIGDQYNYCSDYTMIIVDNNGMMWKAGNIGDDCDHYSDYTCADHKNDYLKKSR